MRVTGNREPVTRPPIREVLARAAAGDSGAWEALVRRYTRRVHGLLLKHCRDGDLAEELTQATFVKLVASLRRFERYEEQGKFEPWLFRVAMNLLRDEMRRRGRQAAPMDMSPAATANADRAHGWAAAEAAVVAGEPNPADDPLAAVSRAEQVQALRRAVEQLPEADRELLHLRHTAGLTFAQIAESLDQPLGTVLARGHRAVKKLKKLLEEAGVVETQ